MKNPIMTINKTYANLGVVQTNASSFVLSAGGNLSSFNTYHATAQRRIFLALLCAGGTDDRCDGL